MLVKNAAVPGDRNVIKGKSENILKYEELHIEMQRMWNVKAKVIPLTKGATETISKSFTQYLSKVPGKHEINPLAPNDVYIRRTVQLTCRSRILNIYSTNILTEYFKHAAHSPFFLRCPLFLNAIFFSVIFTF